MANKNWLKITKYQSWVLSRTASNVGTIQSYLWWENHYIVNTFALPKLIYSLTVLNNPPADIKNKIKWEFFKFYIELKTRQNKTVSHNAGLLEQGGGGGGGRLTNIDYFIEALKVRWVRKIFNEQNKGIWKEFYLENLNAFGGIFNIRK